MDPGNRKILVYQPVYVWLGIAVTLVLLATAGYTLFRHGTQSAGHGLERLVGQRDELERQLEDLQEANVALREKVAVLERSSEIDRQASLDVRNEFAKLQDRLLELRKEVEFYRGIVSPGEASPGLRIQRFHVEPAQQDGSFFYSLMLTQVKRNERYARGVIELDVEGLEDGESKVLVFNKLADDNSKALNYKFRYFQNFEGEIWIPPKFEPQRVRIRLKSAGKGQPPGIEETMEWPTR